MGAQKPASSFSVFTSARCGKLASLKLMLRFTVAALLKLRA
jgi:hypothetical protein